MALAVVVTYPASIATVLAGVVQVVETVFAVVDRRARVVAFADAGRAFKAVRNGALLT